MPRSRKRKGDEVDAATVNFMHGVSLVRRHPLFEPLLVHASIYRGGRGPRPADGYATVTNNGHIRVHPTRLAAPEEWAYVLTHCLLHLGFGHFQKRARKAEWNVACDAYIARFLESLKFGRPPDGMRLPSHVAVTTEDRMYESFCERGMPADLAKLGSAGTACDLVFEREITCTFYGRTDWPATLGEGLAAAASSAVDVAAGVASELGAGRTTMTVAEQARSWFIGSYPLLGSLATSFRIVEDAAVCARLQVSIAAVDAEAKEIYVNPAAGLSAAECRFVIAHELLHVGLSHAARRRGRDPYLWNVACDYVINGWLVEMGVGDLPAIGALYDLELAGESAETVFDRICGDLRTHRKLATLRGVGLGDILDGSAIGRKNGEWWKSGPGLDLDGFYRRCLGQGLAYHEDQGRGLLPAGLVEEIRALSQPPIPWDFELAKWFDEHFSPVEKLRSYARPSRRQSSTPDIPRPRWVPNPRDLEGRTFGVVLDTSGSMDRSLLAKALGSIASYSLSRDVPVARVVFCDAQAYDQGNMPPESIAGSVRVRGRGGTVLQPGIDLLERAEDFPENGPILIITDGDCDRLRVRREHAYLVPHGRHLPFPPKGPVFRLR